MPLERCDRPTTLQAIAQACNTLCVTLAPDRIRPRPPLLRRVGDKRLPAQALAEGCDGVVLAGHAGEVSADVGTHPLGTRCRAAAPTDVVGGPLDLPFPCHGEPPVHPLCLEHGGHRLTFGLPRTLLANPRLSNLLLVISNGGLLAVAYAVSAR